MPDTSHSPKVGFIGLGNIGTPIAEHIANAGFQMVVYDLRKDAALPLLRYGATLAESPEAVARQVDIVCTCLPGPPPEVEKVVLGKNGVLAGIRTGSILMDHTTTAPTTAKELATELRQRGSDMLDAPVTGGMESAQTGQLTVLVGGSTQTLKACRPVLDAISKRVLHTGGIGTGTICKLMFNCAGFSAILAVMECVTVGTRAGVEPAVRVDMFSHIDAISGYMNMRLPATLFKGRFEPPRFSLDLAHKDVTLATDLAKALGVPMCLSDTTATEMSEAVSRGWGTRYSSISLTLQEERAGVHVRLDPTY